MQGNQVCEEQKNEGMAIFTLFTAPTQLDISVASI